MIRASARKQALSAIRLWAPSRSANKQLRRIGRVGLWRKAMMLVTGEGTTDRPCSHGPLDAVGQLPRSVAPAGAGCSPPVSASHSLPPLPQREGKCNRQQVDRQA